MSSFFGLQAENSIESILEGIFALVYYGKFDFESVWLMPVKIRNFYIELLMETIRKEKEQSDNLIKSYNRRK